MEIVFGIILLIAAVFLIVAVLMQDGKDRRLSGTIGGGADTFFGKNKGNTMDKMLSKVTSIVAIVFCVVVVIMYIIQPNTDYSGIISNSGTIDTSNVAGVKDEVDADADADADADTDDAADSDDGADE